MPRLYHHKSRTGCVRCRARRVKCDEARPKCASCTKHDMDCVYDRKPSSPTKKTTSPSDTTIPDSDEWPETRERRLLELNLLHIFTVDVCPTLPAAYEPQGLHAWSVDIPRLAMDSEPLLHSIFAVTLLFLACSPDHELPCSEDDLRRARARYFTSSLKDHRNDLRRMDTGSADAVSFAAVLIVFDAFARLRERRPGAGKHYDPPVEWLQLSRGMHHIVGMGLSLTTDQPDSVLRQLPNHLVEFWHDDYILTEDNRTRFEHLLAPHGDDMILDDIEEKAYTRAISYLGSIANGIDSGEPSQKTSRRLVVKGWLQAEDFVKLVKKLEPRALVVLAHYFALCTKCSWLWWVGDSPLKELEAIEAYLSSDWQELMTWPSQVLREQRRTFLVTSMA